MNERKREKGPEGIKKNILRREDKDHVFIILPVFLYILVIFFNSTSSVVLLILSQMLFICAS